jgi:hypothetical protein
MQEHMMSYGLSKTKILHGLQCSKRLWLKVNQPELAKYSRRALQSIQDGNEAQEVYRGLFPNGILIQHVDDPKTALEETRGLLLAGPSGDPIFEAAFEYIRVLVRADLIFPSLAGFHMVEIKASGSVKDLHLQDCAIQTWVFEKAGIPIKTVALAVINKSFVYPGSGNYYGLFRHEDVTERVRILMPQVPNWVRNCRTILKSAMPIVRTGNQCRNPYECPFIAHCSEPEPPYPVRCLPNRGKIVQELIAEGILDIRDIPESRLTKPIHERVRRVTKSGKAEINPSAKAVLNQFPYPRFYLDFETVAPVVPRWPGTRPRQQIPFQWSCHIEHADGDVEHKWFLDTSGDPPMRAAALSLVRDLGQAGPIFMYHHFEKDRITDLIDIFPDLAPRLKMLRDRLVDLLPIVKEHYYHRDMKGSWGLKSVTKCIAPEMSHARLDEVTDGTAAQSAYQEIIAPETNDVRREDLKKKLLDYCERDTLAMVRITRLLQGD